MKKYLSFFRLRFINGLQYRTAAYAGIATQFAWGAMNLLLFHAFYEADSAAFPMTFPQMASYIWLQQAFLSLFMVWFVDNELFNSVSSGSIAYELTRPADLYSMWFVRTLAGRVSKAVLCCFPILLVAFLLPEPWNLSLPPTVFDGAMFLLTSVFSVIIVVAFTMLVYISAFYTVSPLGVRVIIATLTEFLSGAEIPLPFFPDNIRRILEILPFGAMQNMPLRVYSGQLSGEELLRGIILQIFWCAVLLSFGKLWMNRALKRVVSQGG